jgi:hypothetical protein
MNKVIKLLLSLNYCVITGDDIIRRRGGPNVMTSSQAMASSAVADNPE